jgi:hypothetical protein
MITSSLTLGWFGITPERRGNQRHTYRRPSDFLLAMGQTAMQAMESMRKTASRSICQLSKRF